MNERKRHTPSDRKALILTSALIASKSINYWHVTRTDVADVANVSPGLVSHYLGSVHEIRKAIMAEAIRVEDAAIVLQGLALQDPIAKKAPEALRLKAKALIK